MFGPLNEALEDFHKKWQAIVDARTNKEFFTELRMTGVGWKVEDMKEFDHLFKQLRSVSSQVHLGWVNERWLATFVLRDPAQVCCGVPIVKLMQRRPGSTDPVGLDHVDFFSPAVTDAESVLAKEDGLKWSKENNGEHCQWTSIWFDDAEAKLRTDTTLDVCIAELRDARDGVISNL